MTEGELLIRIKTALESGGLDAAKTKLGDLITSTTEATAASGKQKLQLDGLNTGFSRSAAGIKVLSDLSKGSADSMFAAAGGAQALLSSIGGLGAIGGVVAAITALIGIVMQFRDASERAEKAADAAKKKIVEMDKLKLDNLKKEIERVGEQLQSALDVTEKLYGAQNKLESARTQLAIAEIKKQMPEGRAREDALAKAVRDAEIESEQADARKLEERRSIAKARLADLEAQKEALPRETEAALQNRAFASPDKMEAATAAVRAARRREMTLNPVLDKAIAGVKNQLAADTRDEERQRILREASAAAFKAQQQDVAAARAKEDAQAKAKADELAAREQEKADREAAKSQAAARRAELEQKRKTTEAALKTVGGGALGETAAKEGAEAAAAQQAVAAFDATGQTPDGRRMSRKGSGADRMRRQLVEQANQEQQEADDAMHAIWAAKTTLLQTLQTINTELTNLKEQVRNTNT